MDFMLSDDARTRLEEQIAALDKLIETVKREREGFVIELPLRIVK